MQKVTERGNKHKTVLPKFTVHGHVSSKYTLIVDMNFICSRNSDSDFKFKYIAWSFEQINFYKIKT